VPVVIDRHTVTELLKQEKGRNTVFLLKMKGTKQERHAMVRDAQINPLTRQYMHLDFIRVMKGQRLKVEVPVVLEGESAGVKIGGFLDWVGRSLHVECAAEAIPQLSTSTSATSNSASTSRPPRCLCPTASSFSTILAR